MKILRQQINHSCTYEINMNLQIHPESVLRTEQNTDIRHKY